MAMYGSVVGGHYLNAAVSPGVGSVLVLRSGLKRRKLDEEQIAAWEEITSESKSGTVSAVGQAVTGAVLPRFLSKAASTAVGATLDAKIRPSRTVRIDWVDGKQSLIKLPDKLFTHFGLIMKSRQTSPEVMDSAIVEAVPALATPMSVTEQALTHLSSLISDRLPSPSTRKPEVLATTPVNQSNITEQLTQLAALRDSGLITDVEFTSKKAELLSRF